MLKNNFHILIWIILGTTFHGCKQRTNSNGDIIDKIESVAIHHIIRNYDDAEDKECTRTLMVFNLYIDNQTADTLNLSKLSPEFELCDLHATNPTLMLKMDSAYAIPEFWSEFRHPMKFELIALKGSKSLLAPSKSCCLDCVLLSSIYGASLEEIKLIYGDFLKSNFEIKSLKSNLPVFYKSKNFKVICKLNGKTINYKDSVQMGKASDETLVKNILSGKKRLY